MDAKKHPEPQQDETALVAFDRATLPEQVMKQLGVHASKFRTREVPGVNPAWPEKDAKPGDTLLGVLSRKKDKAGRFNQPVVTVQSVDRGFRDVWCGADLTLKLATVEVGAFVALEYTGWRDIKGREQKMKTFRVVELIPT